MKTSRIIAIIFIVIFFAFFHVFLQTEIIKLGYEVKDNEDTMQQLLENKRVLQYNIYTLESPYRLERYVVAKSSSLKHLDPIHVLGLYSESRPEYVSNKKDSKESLFDNSLLLSLKKLFTGKQAEAKTIK